MSRSVTLGLLVAVAVALVLRCPQLDERPMHNDEAVNAIKFRTLWEQGSYKYDPYAYHGPTLYYFTLAWEKLTGAPDFAHFDEARFRRVTVLFGAGLILLLALMADGLGRAATICAGLLMAISPAMVFYSRYYIHEMLLVFFTLLALAAGWRYTRNPKAGWALLAGAALGLMQATKETFVLTLAAIGGALVLNEIWTRRVEAGEGAPKFKLNLRHAALALAIWVVVAGVFFTSFFSNLQGEADSIKAFLPWMKRAAGESPLVQPWYFFLERLAYFHSARGPVWSEGLILGLAIVGCFVAFTGKGLAKANASFVRFIASFTLLLTIIYSSISYKTPWCLMNFWVGMILLAGVGAVAVVRWMSRRQFKIIASIVLLVCAGQLATQAWQGSMAHGADRYHPYGYAQTSPDILNLVEKVEAVADAVPNGHEMLVKVIAPESDYWPLPWYLRGFKEVGWWAEMPVDPFAPMMIVSAKFHAGLDEKKTHVMAGVFELRPGQFFELYVRSDLWRSYLDAAKTRPADN